MKMKKIGSLGLAALLVSALLPLGGCKEGDKISAELRAQMSDRAENAQFMPDAQTVAGEIEQAVHTVNYAAESAEDEETAFDVFHMERILQDLAVIEGNGGGKYLGYEVDEIKMEMYNMVNRAPWMNEWFRVPRSDGGTEYFSDWAYLIENDLENNFLSITRVSWKTRAYYYDPEQKQEIETDHQYNVMRTKYYMEEETEIVEVEMLDVMKHDGKYHFMAYQGLKNAEDTYFIKYNIEAKPRTRSGYAIDTDTPYGANREFTYMSYGNSDFELLQLTQRYPNAYRDDKELFGQYPAGAQFESTVRKNGKVETYALTYGYAEDKVTPVYPAFTEGNAERLTESISGLAYDLGLSKSEKDGYLQAIEGGENVEIATENLLNALSKQLVDGHYLASNWQKIDDDSENAKEEILPEIALPFKVKYSYVYADAEWRYSESFGEIPKQQVLYRVEAQGYLVPNPTFRNLTECNYYLAPALMSKDGELHFLANEKKNSGNDYDPDYDIMWYGTWLEMERRELTAADFTAVSEDGEYALVLALRENGESVSEPNVFLVNLREGDGFRQSFYIDGKIYVVWVESGQFRVKIETSDSVPEKGEEVLV